MTYVGKVGELVLPRTFCYVSSAYFLCQYLKIVTHYVVVHVDGVRLSLNDGLLTVLFFVPQVIHEYGEPRWNDIDRGNQITRGKSYASAILSTTNPTWTDPEADPGLRVERPATNVAMAYLGVLVPWFGKLSCLAPVWSQGCRIRKVRPIYVNV
jgi:hypothetical protein